MKCSQRLRLIVERKGIVLGAGREMSRASFLNAAPPEQGTYPTQRLCATLASSYRNRMHEVAFGWSGCFPHSRHAERVGSYYGLLQHTPPRCLNLGLKRLAPEHFPAL